MREVVEGVGVRRFRDNFFHVPFFDDATIFHYDHSFARIHDHRHIVRDQNQR